MGTRSVICPTCGRTIGLTVGGHISRHYKASGDGWCDGSMEKAPRPPSEPPPIPASARVQKVSVGDRVSFLMGPMPPALYLATECNGIVVSIHGGDAIVICGNLKFQIPRHLLRSDKE